MTTNPNNAVGTNGAYSGRTSPNALNDVLATFQGRGVLSGWGCVPDSGMTVEIGGNGTDRDVAIAEDNAGNKVPVDNISQSPISVTIPAAPANNSRIDSIVAYVENPPMGTSSDTDNPGAVGLIVVSGTVASTPTAPTDNEIRTGITADGASGSTAYYVVLANVTVPSGATTITGTNIVAGDGIELSRDKSVTSNNIDWATFSGSSDIPVATTTLDLGWQTSMPLLRIGNLVIGCQSTVNGGGLPSGEHNTLTTLASGFRPTTVAALTGDLVTSYDRNVGWEVHTDGSLTFFSPSGVDAINRINISGVWITNDAWPNS